MFLHFVTNMYCVFTDIFMLVSACLAYEILWRLWSVEGFCVWKGGGGPGAFLSLLISHFRTVWKNSLIYRLSRELAWWMSYVLSVIRSSKKKKQVFSKDVSFAELAHWPNDAECDLKHSVFSANFTLLTTNAVSYTHLTLPTIDDV